jgi:uncharacterized membrane protein YfcA
VDLLELLVIGLAGLFGVGGGTAFVPALVYMEGWEIQEAVAASLVVIVFSALSGTLRSMQGEVPVDWRTAEDGGGRRRSSPRRSRRRP